jgi:hypothetical protein
MTGRGGMRMTSITRRRVQVLGGEARLLLGDATAQTFEFERNDRFYFLPWDWRNDGVDVPFDALWTRPSKMSMTVEERDALLDVLWSFRDDSGAIRTILLRDELADCLVVARGLDAVGSFLVHRLRSDVLEYLQAGRTLHVAVETRAEPTGRTLHTLLSFDRARWVFPVKKAVTAEEWVSVREDLLRTTDREMMMTTPGWRIADGR